MFVPGERHPDRVDCVDVKTEPKIVRNLMRGKPPRDGDHLVFFYFSTDNAGVCLVEPNTKSAEGTKRVTPTTTSSVVDKSVSLIMLAKRRDADLMTCFSLMHVFLLVPMLLFKREVSRVKANCR